MWHFHIILIILCMLSILCSSENTKYKIVKIKNGPIKGRLESTLVENLPFYAFRAVPYARPPTGRLRFKPPQNPLNWTKPLDTFKYGSACPNYDIFLKKFNGNEDCLFVNIFTPTDFKTNINLNVMVFIHGGLYEMRSSSFYGSDFLVNQNVILVTFNYRLGPLGFLSLGTAEYSGNMGLKDQRKVLEWVQENIAIFGGNKNKVTLFGQSVGGTSTHFHMLYSKPYQYFKRCIMMSGAALNNFGRSIYKNHRDLLYDFAKSNGNVKRGNYNELVEYLLNVDSEFLVRKTFPTVYIPGKEDRNYISVWAPVLESNDANEPIITIAPEILLKQTNRKNWYDTFFGHTSKEWSVFSADEYKNETLLDPFNEKFIYQLPLYCPKADYNSTKFLPINKEIRSYFFGWNNGQVDKKSVPQYVDLMSDQWYTYATQKSAQYQVLQTYGKTYYYRFSIESRLNMSKDKAITLPGVSHSEDLFYLLKQTILPDSEKFYKSLTHESLEYKYIKQVTEVFANFAKTGDPSTNSITIIPMSPTRNYAIDITNNGLIQTENLSNMEFWDQLYNKHEIV